MPSVYGGGKDDPFDRQHELAKAYTQRGDEKIQDALETLAINGVDIQAWIEQNAIGEPETDPRYGQVPEHQEMVEDKVVAGINHEIGNIIDAQHFPYVDTGEDYGGYEGE